MNIRDDVVFEGGAPACVDKNGGVFHLGEKFFVADLLSLWC